MESTTHVNSEGLIQIARDRVLTDIILKPAQSSRLSAYAYDKANRLLYVAFPNACVYEYEGVEPDTFDGFDEADSKGKFFLTNISGPRGSVPPYPYRKVKAENQDEDAKPSEPKAEIIPVPKHAIATIPELPAKNEELKTRALTVQSHATSLAIVSGETYTRAESLLVTIKAERKLVYDRLQRVYDPAFKAYVEARTLRDESVAPYDEAERILKASMLGFVQQEKRDREAAERAERQRLEAEERDRAKAESEETARRDAEHLRAQGEHEVAAQVEANPLPVAPRPIAPVVMASAIPKGVGRAAIKESWKFRIVDESKIPLTHEFYSLDEGKIGRRARDLKQHANIPGVEVYDAGSIAAPRS